MLKIRIYTYNPKSQMNQFDIFALSKGLNSGKPLALPCPNCFVLSCRSQEERDFFHTLLYGLWKIKHFERFLVGSVIPFLRISDFKNQLYLQAEKVSIKPEDFRSDIKRVKLIEQKQEQYYEQMLILNEVKRALIYRHLKNR